MAAADTNSRLLEVRELVKHFPYVRRRAGFPQRLQLQAVDGVSFGLGPRETMALVGESGCGKTTTGKLVAGLLKPTAGSILYKDEDLLRVRGSRRRALRRSIQMVFQDSLSSLNPRMRVGSLIEEPFVVNRIGTRSQRREWVGTLLSEVGLPLDAATRYPHEFSGGQRQRIGIARALALSPELVVADEPVSALDVSIQAQIINLLLELKEKRGLSMIFIAHDLSVVRSACETVAVMYLGRIMELGPTEEVFDRPQHPYTRALLSSVPVPDPSVRLQAAPLTGEVPSPVELPPGCRFAARCDRTMPRCRAQRPSLAADPSAPSHAVACFLYDYVGVSS